MATTLDVIVDRVRSLCGSVPFEFQESARLDRFAFDPAQMFGTTAVFRVDTQGLPGRGGSAFSEERTDLITVAVGRAINADYDGTRRELLRCAHSLSAAIVRDGAEDSGSYTVPDQGFRSQVETDSTASYLTLRLTLPVNYEGQL